MSKVKLQKLIIPAEIIAVLKQLKVLTRLKKRHAEWAKNAMLNGWTPNSINDQRKQIMSALNTAQVIDLSFIWRFTPEQTNYWMQMQKKATEIEKGYKDV